MPLPRRSLAIRLLAFAALVPLALSAQTVLKLTYPGSGSPCVFTSDAQGVRLDPNTGELLASGDFGSGCPSGQVASPSFSNSLTSSDDTTGSVAVTTGSITLNWSANADTCSYTGTSFPVGATVSGWPTSGTACSDSTTCSNLHTLNHTPTVVGTYNFSLQCFKTGNPTPVISTASIDVSSGGSGETACSGTATILSRQTTAQTYFQGSGASMNSNTVDVFKNVWGRDPNDPVNGVILDFPNRAGANSQLTVAKNKFVSLKFVVPTGLPSTTNGTFIASQTTFGGVTFKPFSFTVSHNCYGEFDNDSPDLADNGLGNHSFCYQSNTGTGVMAWTLSTAAANQFTCRLTPGETYYLNMVSAPLTSSDTTSGATSNCTSSCAIVMGSSFQQ